jgi:hypothetical protein
MRQGSRRRGLHTSDGERQGDEGAAVDALAPCFHRRPYGMPPDEPCPRCLERRVWSCPADGTHAL